MRAVHLLAAVAAAALAAQAVAEAITVTEINRRVQNRLVRGWVAQVDLADPTVEVLVTDRPPAGTAAEAVLTRTDAWQGQTGATLAVNANFFATLSGGLADIVGVSVSDGVQISPVRRFGTAEPDPAIVFNADRTATVGRITQNQALAAVDAVAGVGPSDTDNDAGSLLVDDGVNLGAGARVQPSVRNPRTAVGVSQDGRTLIVMVIDGRQSGWSEGVTNPQLADLMIEFGAWDAVNLDGGGSSSFIYDDGTTRIENRPSDGSHRAVANHLGVRINTPAATTTQRPIRGVWLRPPSNISALDAQLATLANAGITDLYLETFYWGLATHDSSVFNDRFSFDYLEQAIIMAARRGIHVHAWLEAAYWSFSGSGNYILDQHPEWKVRDYLGNTNIGDISGQVFVNIGIPAVQAKLRELTTELARYPGLWGIQTDYHRFPLDNNTSDSQPAPYSYDLSSQLDFFNLTGATAETDARFPSSPFWNQWVDFQRERIAQAANQMKLGMDSVAPELDFSAAIFASAATNSSQLVKMQDWPRMASRGYIDVVVPMAYGTSSTSIRNDIATAVANASGRRVAAGLAILTNITRPSIPQQLAAARAEGVTDFILFDASTLTGNTAMLTDLKNTLLANGPYMPADLDQDLRVDGRDWFLFNLFYQGTPVSPTPATARADIDGSGLIDDADREALYQNLRLSLFGSAGVVDQRDLDALLNAWTGPGTGSAPVTGVVGLYDLDADGDVDYDDQLRLHRLLTVALPPDLDVNRDARVDIDDLYEQVQRPLDVNRDGFINGADEESLEAALRAGELDDMKAGRRP